MVLHVNNFASFLPQHFEIWKFQEKKYYLNLVFSFSKVIDDFQKDTDLRGDFEKNLGDGILSKHTAIVHKFYS